MSRLRQLWDELRACFTLARHTQEPEWDLKISAPSPPLSQFPRFLRERKFDYYGMEITASYWEREDQLDDVEAYFDDPFTLTMSAWRDCGVEQFDAMAWILIEKRYPRGGKTS